MKIITPASLFVALLLSAPALWQAWSNPSVDISGVLVRFLLAVLAASVGLQLLRAVIETYQRVAGQPRRRVDDRSRPERDLSVGDGI